MLRRNLCAAGAIAGLATFARGAECLAPAAPALAGKTAVIFGGTSGIGLAAAIALRAEGADVVAVSRNPSRASAEAERHNISLVACDVRDRSALDATLRALPKLDIIVAAATGGKRAVGPFLEMDMEGYQGSFDKLWGYANIVRYGAPLLPPDGCVVLVSGAPARGPQKGQVSLASVGGAVEQFARALAPELAPRRINVVSPGVISTPMFGEPSEEREATLSAKTAQNLIPRAGRPEEVADAIMFVVKNKFVTGTTVDVDGGWLSGPHWR